MASHPKCLNDIQHFPFLKALLQSELLSLIITPARVTEKQLQVTDGDGLQPTGSCGGAFNNRVLLPTIGVICTLQRFASSVSSVYGVLNNETNQMQQVKMFFSLSTVLQLFIGTRSDEEPVSQKTNR